MFSEPLFMIYSLFTYLLETSICLAAFYLFFRLLLQKEPLLQKNRFFILSSVLLSIAIPLIDIPLQEQAIFYAPVFVLQDVTVAAKPAEYRFPVEEYVLYAYVAVCMFLLLRLIWQTGKLLYFSRKNRSSKTGTYQLILTEGKLPTFSFFRLLFWDNSQPFTEEQKLQVLRHELAHIRQWHSLDIIFLELVKIFFWFHPAVYLFKQDLQQTHEYLADAEVVQKHSRETYVQLIVAQVLHTSNLSLVNPFSQFKTKNRILMLHKLNRAKPAFWKIALSLPLIALLVLIYSCDTTNPEELLASKRRADIREVVDDMPAPVNGLVQDISSKINYPEKAKNENIEGIVFVQFVVKKDGSVDDVKVLNGIGAGCDEEAVRVVQTVKWNPGKEQGKPVGVRMVMPIAFALSDEKRQDFINRSIPQMQSQEQHDADMYELQAPSASSDERLMPPPPPPPRVVYQVVEVQPQPIGGIDALMKYLGENIRYPEEARKKGVEGKVFVQLVVDADGSISEVQVLKGIGYGCDEEAVRVIKAMPAWKPGTQKGEPVNVRMSMPINFKLD
jgi:TonB family protein